MTTYEHLNTHLEKGPTVPNIPNNKPVPADTSETALATLSSWAQEIPALEEGSAESIASVIMDAQSPEELAAAWDSTSSKDLVGHTLRIESIQRGDSEYSDGLGIFLVVKGADLGTGEQVTFTTGAVNVTLQLVKAHHEKWLPIDARIEQAERATRDGYYPLRLKILGASF